MSGYTGYKVAGWPGAVAATSGMAFPSMVLMLVLAVLYFKFRDTSVVQGMLRGVRPAVVALLAVVVIQVWPESMGGIMSFVIAAMTLVAVLFFRVHPALAIVLAATIGLLVRR
jgi:chromate transporter